MSRMPSATRPAPMDLTGPNTGRTRSSRRDRSIPWEQRPSRGCQVEKHGDYYLMFYIGFRDIDHAQIGLARSQGRHHRLAASSGQPDHPPGPRTSGTTTPATSPMPSSTAGNGCSGTTAATAAWSRSAWCCTRARTWVSIGYPQSLDGPRSYDLHGSVTTTVWFSAGAAAGQWSVLPSAVSATMSYSKSSAAAGNGRFVDSAGDMPGSNLVPLAVAQRPHLQGHGLHGPLVQGNDAKFQRFTLGHRSSHRGNDDLRADRSIPATGAHFQEAACPRQP